MTKTLKKILSRGALGTGIGNIISMLVALVIGIAGKNPQMTIYDYAKYTCAATVIGFAFAAASLSSSISSAIVSAPQIAHISIA